MKKSILIASLAICSLVSAAQEVSNGFYRVQNYGSKRYAYVVDCTGSINIQATSADMGAIALYSDVNKRFTDPASVIYIENHGSNGNYYYYDLKAQGTGVYGIIGHYVSVQADRMVPGTYCVVQPDYNMYLWDGSTSTAPKSYVQTKPGSNEDYRRWTITPLDASTDEYLGLAPKSNLQLNGKYYKPYFLSFAMDFASAGMKAYYVSDIKPDAVIIKEVTGVIPAATPVIVECGSADGANNRLNVYYRNEAPISGNRLVGNYFCYGSHKPTDRLLYNPSTMRMLAVQNGRLKFVRDDNHEYTTQLKINNVINYYVPANESYLAVDESFPATIDVMTEAEYNALHPSGKKGDVNGDGNVNTADAVVLYRYIASGKTIKDAPKADVNGDGIINTADAVVLYRLIAAGN